MSWEEKLQIIKSHQAIKKARLQKQKLIKYQQRCRRQQKDCLQTEYQIQKIQTEYQIQKIQTEFDKPQLQVKRVQQRIENKTNQPYKIIIPIFENYKEAHIINYPKWEFSFIRRNDLNVPIY